MQAAPKKSARGRGQDQLILFLWIEGGVNIAPDKITDLLSELHASYFAKRGTVTSALKLLIEEANNVILSHNRRYTSSGRQAFGHMTALVSKHDIVYIAQSGKGHGFLLQPDKIDHMHDPESAGVGLGINRSPSIKFFQKQLNQSSKLLLLNLVPNGWNAKTLSDTEGQTLSTLRRRFLGEAGQDYQGFLIDPIPGTGELNIISSVLELEKLVPTPVDQPENEFEKNLDQPFRDEIQPTQEKAKPPPVFSYEKRNDKELRQEVEDTKIDSEKNRIIEEKIVENPVTIINDEIDEKSSVEFSKISLSFLQSVGKKLGNGLTAVRVFSQKLIPNDFSIQLPSSIMAIVAIAVPLILSAIAASIFFNQGANQQYQLYFNQAQVAYQQAVEQSDPIALLNSWEDVLENIENAERYRETDEAAALKVEAQAIIDYLEKITRIEYQAIILGTLAETINIKQIVVSGKDLYMLDSNSGEVIRALFTGAKYEIDSDFICEPHAYGTIIVGDIVDIISLPRLNTNNASIMAMDSTGNLMYCIPESPPLVVSLAVPDTLWGKPNAITLENNNLYVLDPLSNAVWFYEGIDLQFQTAPKFFFIDNVPNLSGAIDIAINKDDLYVLYEDGHTIKCAYSKLAEAPTDCIDPVIYQDDRQGKESTQFFPGATFYQLMHTQPPEPALYYLDPIEGTIYHFTLQLNLVNQYRPFAELEGEFFSAMTIVDNQSVYLAKGNEVYLGYIP